MQPLDPMTMGAAAPSQMLWGLIIFVISYAWTAYFLMRVAGKLNHQYPWLAWVPLANIVLMVQLAGYSGWWTLLLALQFIPTPITALIVMLLGVWVLSRIARNANVNPFWSLVSLVPFIGVPVFFTIVDFLTGKEATKDDEATNETDEENAADEQADTDTAAEASADAETVADAASEEDEPEPKDA